MSRASVSRAFAIALVLIPVGALACGPEFGKEVPDAQAVKYVGLVRDTNGQPVGNTTIIASLEGHEITTDAKGNFLINLGRDEDSPDIHFVCRKAGYQTVMGKKTPSRTDKLRIVVTCSMKPA